MNMYKIYIGLLKSGTTSKMLQIRLHKINKLITDKDYENFDQYFELLFLRFDSKMALLLFEWMKNVPDSTFERILKNDSN